MHGNLLISKEQPLNQRTLGTKITYQVKAQPKMVTTEWDEECHGLYPEETSVEIVTRLLRHEARQPHGGLDLSKAAEGLCLRMQPYLVDVMGAVGLHAMMVHARSLMIRSIERTRPNLSLLNLNLVTIDDDGCLRWLEKSELDSPDQAIVVATLAHFFDLLTAFIGQNLVLRMIHQEWTDFVVLLPFSRSKKMLDLPESEEILSRIA